MKAISMININIPKSVQPSQEDMEEALRIEDNPAARMATRFPARKVQHFREVTKMMLDVYMVVRLPGKANAFIFNKLWASCRLSIFSVLIFRTKYRQKVQK